MNELDNFIKPWDGDPEEDPDKVRRHQAILAVEAINNKMTVALRNLSPKACEWCESQKPIVDIWHVVSGSADHPLGLCTWEFFPSYQDAMVELKKRLLEEIIDDN